MRKTGIVWIGHEDYLGENTSAVQRAVYDSVKDIPLLEVESESLVVTEKEAVAAVRRIVEEKNCCGALVVLTTWVECNVVMSALKELRGRSCMFWGFPPREVEGRNESTGSYVSATMFAGVVKRLGLPCPVLFTSWTEPETLRQIEVFAQAAGVIDELRYAKVGLFGYTSMSIYTGTFDHVLMRYRIGPEIEQMDTYSLLHAAGKAKAEELKEAEKRLRNLASLREDVAPEILKKTLEIYVALGRFCKEKGWQAVNVKCQYELSKEYRVIPCVALSLLAEDGITASCEGDILNTVSMLILHHFTKQTVWYGDSLTHWDNVLQFSPCGFMPFSLSKGTPYVQNFPQCLGFHGLHVSGVLRPEKVTWMRLIEDVGEYHLLYGTGRGIETMPRGGCQPALNVELDGKIEELCKEYSGQHFAVVYGDLSEQVQMYAALMGIEARRI